MIEDNLKESSEGLEMSFEQALQSLESIVRNLESGNLSLNESLQIFEQGIRLSRVCYGKLEEAERKIDLLVTGNDGKIKLKSAEILEGGEA